MYSTPARELVELIFELSRRRSHNLVEAKITERQAASRYLKQLIAAGVLEGKAVGRERRYLHPKLLGLLTREGNEVVGYG